MPPVLYLLLLVALLATCHADPPATTAPPTRGKAVAAATPKGSYGLVCSASGKGGADFNGITLVGTTPAARAGSGSSPCGNTARSQPIGPR